MQSSDYNKYSTLLTQYKPANELEWSSMRAGMFFMAPLACAFLVIVFLSALLS